MTQPAQPVHRPDVTTSSYRWAHWSFSGGMVPIVGGDSHAVRASGDDGGMDLTYPQEAESFRKEIRTWLEENLPAGWFDEGFELKGEERERWGKAWTKKLHE